MSNEENFKKLKEKVENYLIEELDLDPELIKNPKTELESLEIDSIDKAELALQLEEEFGFQLENDPKLLELKTIEDVVEYFKEKIKE